MHSFTKPTRPSPAEVQSTPPLTLLLRFIHDPSHRYWYTDLLYELTTREDLARFLLKDDLLLAMARSWTPPAEPEVKPKSRKPQLGQPQPGLFDKADPLSPQALLLNSDGSFNPLTKTWDQEFPTWAICRAILSTAWQGEALGAYSARDVYSFMEEMEERRIVGGSDFDSPGQERMLKSVVSRFNNWARRNLTRESVQA